MRQKNHMIRQCECTYHVYQLRYEEKHSEEMRQKKIN